MSTVLRFSAAAVSEVSVRLLSPELGRCALDELAVTARQPQCSSSRHLLSPQVLGADIGVPSGPRQPWDAHCPCVPAIQARGSVVVKSAPSSAFQKKLPLTTLAQNLQEASAQLEESLLG